MPGNARRGRPQGKCHREQTAGARLRGLPVRVKGCGKSAPRRRQRRRHGKPHREQDQVGTAAPAFARRRQARFRAVVRVGRARRPATGVPEEWSSTGAQRPGQNPAYRPSGTYFLRERQLGPSSHRHVAIDENRIENIISRMVLPGRMPALRKQVRPFRPKTIPDDRRPPQRPDIPGVYYPFPLTPILIP